MSTDGHEVFHEWHHGRQSCRSVIQLTIGNLGHLAVRHQKECVISLPVAPVTHSLTVVGGDSVTHL